MPKASAAPETPPLSFADFAIRHPVGRDFLDAQERDRDRREMRQGARDSYDESEVVRAELPALIADVGAAQDALDRAIREGQTKVFAARRAKGEALDRLERLRRQGEDVLRRTADPLVHDRGPVLRALEEARLHLRGHVIRDEIVLGFAADRKPKDPEGEKAWHTARRDVEASNDALERLAAFDFALAEVRDMQLAVDVDRDELRLILDACPARCGCGAHLGYGPPTASVGWKGLVPDAPPSPTHIPPWTAALEGVTTR
jgi:hypothetical protein